VVEVAHGKQIEDEPYWYLFERRLLRPRYEKKIIETELSFVFKGCLIFKK